MIARYLKSLLLIAALLCQLLPALAQANERILSFHSDVVIEQDGTLKVSETIVVQAEGRNIKRGIYRDLPTRYKNAKYGHWGLTDRTPMNITGVWRNGRKEPYRKQGLGNGFRIFIGSENHYLRRGQHEYTIQYTAERQVLQSDDAARVNWNVTGQGWVFPIDQASATFYFPDNISPSRQIVFTGDSGSRDSNATAKVLPDGSLQVQTTRFLNPYQGLTVDVEFSKTGLAPPMSPMQRLFADNLKWFGGIFLLLAMPLYYFNAWRKVGRDPEKGVVVADYHPVREMSPAAHRFAVKNRSDNKSFAAAVLNMAVKGYLSIEQKSKKVFVISRRNEANAPLSAGEKIIYDNLLKHRNRFTLGKGYKPKVALARKRFAARLKSEHGTAIYRNNRRYTWLGLLIGLLGLGLVVANGMAGSFDPSQLFPLALFFFVGHSLSRNNSGSALLMAIIPIAIAGWFLLNGAVSGASSALMLFALFVAAMFLLFQYLLKAPTPFGQKLLDEIEGFRLYLGTAEQNRLDILHPPEKTPELFEKLLPYALALDVENQWSEQFAKVFKDLENDPNRSSRMGRHYSPSWYSGGRFGGFSNSGFASGLSSSLASSVASASAAPSSSSGGFSGGGGFGGGGAGGGGGGGGGGGW